MLPNNTPSVIPLQSPFLSPDDRKTTVLSDYERGGVGMNDASQGLTARNWRCWLDGFYVRAQAEGDPNVYTLFAEDQINELAFCFDQNMRWAVAYTLPDVMKLRWYDTMTGDYTVSIFPLGRNPKLAMDDKRAMHMDTNDIIFAYIRDSTVYYRVQRDRFEIEYVAKTGLFPRTRLNNIGMNNRLRFQFELV